MTTLYGRAFREGATFDRFLEEALKNRDMWQAMADRARVPDEASSRLEGLEGCWRLLVLADDWCGDAVSTLPTVAALAGASPHLELRIVPRDRYPEIRDRHLTNGSRSIPIVIVLGEEWEPLGHWGPRPSSLQDRFERELRPLPADDRYRELRKWYARDRGMTTADEVRDLVLGAALRASGRSRIPCSERRAA